MATIFKGCVCWITVACVCECVCVDQNGSLQIIIMLQKEDAGLHCGTVY